MGKTILKCIWNNKGPQKAKTILRMKNKDKDFILLDFQTHYKARGTKQYGTGIKTDQ